MSIAISPFSFDNYPLMELVKDDLDRMYVYGVTGMVTALAENSTTYHVVKDHLGCIRAVLNSSNQVATNYCYDPFGKATESNVIFDIHYTFTGQEFDSETGLHNYRARMYDNFTKRFNAVDPMLEFASPFCYVGNNPVSFIDPTGMASILTYIWDGISNAGLSFLSAIRDLGEWAKFWRADDGEKLAPGRSFLNGVYAEKDSVNTNTNP